MTTNRKLGIGLLAFAALVVLVVWRIEAASTRILQTRYPAPERTLAVAPAPSQVQDGARLAHVNGCFSCHGADLSGRVMFTGWFGTRLVASNLTRLVRHRSDEQLAAAIRYGLRPDGSSLIDMPSDKFIKSSDGDIAAIIAYLRTLPQKPDAAGKTIWRFGGRAMLAMGLLPRAAAMVDRTARGPVQTPTEAIALGDYLTHSQCSVCHGPDLSGDPQEDSPSLRFSIKHYSPAVFARFFTTGQGRKGHGTQVMTQLVLRRFHYLTQDEVRAIFVYLNNSKPKT